MFTNNRTRQGGMWAVYGSHKDQKYRNISVLNITPVEGLYCNLLAKYRLPMSIVNITYPKELLNNVVIQIRQYMALIKTKNIEISQY